MGTEGETEVDDDGKGLDEGCDKQDFSRFVGGVCSEEVEDESVECYNSIPTITMCVLPIILRSSILHGEWSMHKYVLSPCTNMYSVVHSHSHNLHPRTCPPRRCSMHIEYISTHLL